MSRFHAITNQYKYLNGTNLWDSCCTFSLSEQFTWGALQEKDMKDAARNSAIADAVSLCSPCAQQRTTRYRKSLSDL